jgi:hypothetical protein
MLESRNHGVLLVIVFFPGLQFILVDSLLVLSHISIHFKGIVLGLLGVEFILVPVDLLLLGGKNTLVDNSILIDVLLNLGSLVVLDGHLVTLFSEFIILHLLDELVLVIHALTELLFLHEASSGVHAEHSFLLTLALVLGFADLALAFRTAYSSEVIVVHALLKFISLLHSISLCGVTVSELLNGSAHFHASFSLSEFISYSLLLHGISVSLLEYVLSLCFLCQVVLVVSISSNSIALHHIGVKLLFIHFLLVFQRVFYINTVLKLLSEFSLIVAVVSIVHLLLHALHSHLVQHLFALLSTLHVFNLIHRFFLFYSFGELTVVVCGISGFLDGVLLLLTFPSFSLMLDNSTPLIQVTLSTHRVVTLSILVKVLNFTLLLFKGGLSSVCSQLQGIHDNMITHTFYF